MIGTFLKDYWILIAIVLLIFLVIFGWVYRKYVKENWFLILMLFVALTPIVFFTVIYLLEFKFAMPPADDKTMGTWGTFGDYFGGTLNPTLAFCSFMALLYTVRLQSKELRNSTDQLAQSANAQKEMEKTQRLQQFEGLFTYMANEISKIYENIREDKTINELSKTIITNHWDKEKIIYEIRKHYNLTRFFIFLYQVLKYIKSSNLIEEEQKKYSNLIRSSIETPVLQLLLINSIEYDEYRSLLTEYNFFEHMSFLTPNGNYAYNIIYATNFHDENAFDKSVYYATLKKSNLLLCISSKKELSNYKLFFHELIQNKVGYIYEKITETGEFDSTPLAEKITVAFENESLSLNITPKTISPNTDDITISDGLTIQRLLQSNILNRVVEYNKFELLNLNDNEIIYLADGIDRYYILLIFNNQQNLRIFVMPNSIGLTSKNKDDFELFKLDQHV